MFCFVCYPIDSAYGLLLVNSLSLVIHELKAAMHALTSYDFVTDVAMYF